MANPPPQNVPPAGWTKQDEAHINDSGWVPRDATDWQQYVPFWCGPEYDPEVEISQDGTQQRAAKRDAATFLQPALLAPTQLQRDTGDRPTKYAR